MSSFTSQIISGLLFSHPLFDYSENRDGKKQMKILIAGDSCNEKSDIKVIFSKVFNCGQMTEDYPLFITVASSDPVETESLFNKAMPGLNSLKHLFSAEIDYTDVDKVNAADYGYIIIACEDKKKSENLFSEFAKQINGKKALLCMFGSEDYSCIDRDIYKFADADIAEQNGILRLEDLNRYAYNCDFSYGQNEDERNPIRRRPRLSAVGEDGEAAFFSDSYSYSHSISFAAHIPYKLEICADNVGAGKASLELLLDIIINKQAADGGNEEYKAVYNKLLYVEHRRWCADMATDGWNMPDDVQLQETFANGNRQKIGSLKLHPCLCAGSDKGCLLSDHFELWDECRDITTLEGVRKKIADNHPGLNLSELEMISLALYGITNQRVKALCKETHNLDDLFDFINEEQDEDIKSVLERLHKAANRLRDGIPNSASLYKTTMDEAKEIAEDYADRLGEIEKKLEIITERNRRKNYFIIDEAMIDCIPFMMWFGRDYRTVIVLSSGLAAEDVIVPTLLYPEKAVFIGNFESEGYEKAIKEYFISRHVNTEKDVKIELNFINAHGNICEVLKSELKNNVQNVPVVSLSHGLDAMDILKASAAVGNNVPLIEYSGMHITGLINANKRFHGLISKSFSVSEYICLLQGELTKESKYKEYRSVPDEDKFARLTEVFAEHSVNKRYGKNISHEWRNISQKVENQKADAVSVFEGSENSELKADKEKLIEALERNDFISFDKAQKTVTFKDEKIRALFSKSGEMLEMLIYIKAKQSGLFSDVQQGQKFLWGTQNNSSLKNEIDIILTSGMTPIFISCKDRAFVLGNATDSLNEIRSIADCFMAVPVLVLTDEINKTPEYLSDINNSTYYKSFKERAKELNISLLGRDTIFDDDKLLRAFKTIKAGKILP